MSHCETSPLTHLYLGLCIELTQDFAAEGFVEGGVSAARLFAVDGEGAEAEVAGAGDDDLIGIEEVGKVEGFLLHGHIQAFAGLQEVLPGDAGQDQVVGRRREKGAVFEDMDVAVGAFGDPAAGAVEDGLLAACLFCLLGGHDRGDQVEGLDIAVEEAGILAGDQRDRLRSVIDVGGAEHDPEVARPFLIGVVSVSCAPGHLVVDEDVSGIQLSDQVFEQGVEFRLFHRDPDVQLLRVIVKAVEVFLLRKNMVIVAGAGVIDAVSEPADSVVHGNGHVFDQIVTSVVVTKIFHRVPPDKDDLQRFDLALPSGWNVYSIGFDQISVKKFLVTFHLN